MANDKSSLVQIAQATLDETNQAVKVNIVAAGGAGGIATEATLLLVEADTSSIDAKTPALGQALAAGSVPVVLTAAQVSTLTPQTNALTDAQLRATAVPVSAAQSGTWNITNVSGTVSLPTGAATSAAQVTSQASFDSIDGKMTTLLNRTTTTNNSLASIDAKVPALGQALAAASTPVVLTAAQISTLTPLSTVAVTQSTSPWVTSRNWTLASGSDSVASVQSGTWTVARSWTLASGTDSVSAVQSGTWNITNISGTISLPTGAATSANQTTANSSLSSLDTKAVQNALNYGAASGAVRVAAQIGNASAVADFGAGASSAQTLRVVRASTSGVQLQSASLLPYFQDFSSGNLTTSYTQVIASTGATINKLSVTNNSGANVYIATGAAASEIAFELILAGEARDIIVNIPSATRLSIRSVSGTVATGTIKISAWA